MIDMNAHTDQVDSTMNSGSKAMNMRARQQGTTLLELLIVLLIMTSVILGATALVDNFTQNMRISLTAQHMSQFGNAVQAYIKDNYQTVAGVSASNAPAPLIITVANLTLNGTSNKYLPASFDKTNSYGQIICALVLQPTTGTLNALVVTEGGYPPANPAKPEINDVDLAQLAGMIGAAGGAIYTFTPTPAIAPTLAVGTMGKWKFNIAASSLDKTSKGNCTTGQGGAGTVALASGHPLMALWFSSDTSDAFLYRNQVPGHEELNSMNTNLVFDSNMNEKHATLGLPNIRVADQFGNLKTDAFGNPKTIEVGDECGYSAATIDYTTNPAANPHPPQAIPIGTLGTDSLGRVLSCQNVVNGGIGDPVTVKLWQVQASLYWGEPVDTYNDLAGNLLLLKPGIPCNPTTATQWQTRIVKYPAVSSGPGSGPRAYTCNPLGTNPAYPSHWEPLAADDQGILTLGTTQIEGGKCFNKGMMSMNNAGILMSCQPNPQPPFFNMWVAVGSSSAHYRFTIMGYIDWNKDRMVGTGVMKTSGGVSTFTGTLWCDPTLAAPVASQGQEYPQPGGGTVPHQACGSGGTWELPSPSPLIAYQAALGRLPTVIWDEYGYSSAPLLVSVADLPVFYYEKVW